MPRVSVLLPYRDASDTLEEAVRSIQAQSLGEWELLAVNDRSTDDGPDLLRRHLRDDPRIRMLESTKPGIVHALNTGLGAAQAPLIARMDADDTCHPERLAKQLAFLESHADTGLVSCRVTFGGNTERQAGYARHVAWTNGLLTPEDLARHRFVDCPFAHPSVLFRAELVQQHGGYRDGDFPEDYECWLRWWDAGVRFAKLEEALLTWNDPQGRLSRTDPRYSPASFAAVRAPYLARELDRVAGDRPVWLWGAGRVSRRRSDPLRALRPMAGYVDIDPRRIGKTLDGLPVIAPEQLPAPDQGFVVPQVASPGAREKIAAWLEAHGYRLGSDWLPSA